MSHAPLEPAEVARVLAGYDRPWWIAGGVALDLWLGRATRAHEDVDVDVLRRDQAALREHLAGRDLRYATPQHVLEPWDGRRLELPVHELWGRREATGAWQAEFLLDAADGKRWIYRRDPAVSLPLDRAGDDHVLAPQVVLLYKSKDPRERDDADLAAVAPELRPDQRSWLRSAIAHTHPEHPWLARLDRT